MSTRTTVPDAAGGPRRRLTGCTGCVWTRVVLDVVCEVALLCVLSLKNISYRPGSTWRKSTLVPAAPAAPQQLPSQLLSHAAVPLRRPSDELVCGRRAPSLSRSATTWIQGVRSRPAEDFLMGSLSTIPALERGLCMNSHRGARWMLVLSLSARPFTHPVAASCTAGTNHPRSRA